MIAGSLARRYARAFYDVGAERGIHERLESELGELVALYLASRDLVEALSNPVFPRTQRRLVLEAVLGRLGASRETRNFSLLLLDRERMPYLPAIARELQALVDEKTGRVRAKVVSAQPLPEDQAQAIERALQRLVTQGGPGERKNVLIEKTQDPSLIGGVVAKVGDVVYDGSVRTQLELLREQVLPH